MNNTIKSYENENYKIEITTCDICESPREWHTLGTMICKKLRNYTIGDKQIDISKYNDYYDMLLAELSWELNVCEENLQTEEQKEELLDKAIHIPVSMYLHSTMNLSKYAGSQIGWLYCTKEKMKKETGYTEKELYSGSKDREPCEGEHIKINNKKGWGVIIKKYKSNNNYYVVNFDYNKLPSHQKNENIILINEDEITEVMSYEGKKILERELDVYNKYCRGEVYGYVVYEKDYCPECDTIENIEIDRCSGFYGLNIEKNGMLNHMPSEAITLIKSQK